MAGLRMGVNGGGRMPFSLDQEPFPTIVEHEPPVLVPLKPPGGFRQETSAGGKRRGARGRRADFTLEIGDSIPGPLSPTSAQEEGPSTFSASAQLVTSQNSGHPTESQSQMSPARVTPPPQRPGKPSLIRDKSGNGKSMSSLWGERPKAAVDRAMRFFGMKSSSDQSLLQGVQESASELFEFCLTICMATSPEIMKLMLAFGSEEKRALQRLMGLARKMELLGNETRGWDFPAPVTELATAFLEEAVTATRRQQEEKEKEEKEKKANKSGSSMSLSAFARMGLKQASRVGQQFSKGSTIGNRSTLTIDGGGPLNRSTSNVGAVLGLQSSSTDLGGILGLRRSASAVSDMSSSSFTDFNNKRRLGQNGEPELRPSFLDFLYSLGAEEAAVGNKVMRQMPVPGAEGVPISMDINLPIRAEGKLDTVSEAGISYHSAYDAVYASEGESREVVQAEVVNINGVEGGQSTVRIAFRSKCLRTQNEWQRRLLTQQKLLLNMVSNKLKLAEQTVKAGDELRDEQKELLRGFRKIVVREANEADHDVIVYVVEKNEELRHEVGELCKILEFPFQACEDLQIARQLIARDVALPPITSRASSEWTAATDHNLDRTATHSIHGASLLEGRPGLEMRDWRSRALTPKSTTSKTPPPTGSRRRSKETSESTSVIPADSSRIRLVLLGSSFLEEDLPREWQDDGIFVVLTSETEEFEEVGKILMASGEGEMRENLRRKGIGQYLLHPLSLEGLRGTVNEAYRKRFAHEYLLLQGVGRGTSGIVHRAKRLPDGGHFALKEINVKRLTRLAKAEVEREQKLLKEMSWPTVIFLVDTWENTVDRLRYIAMPLLDGGSLQAYIEKKEVDKFEKETLEMVAEWYAQTVHGLTYLHWRGVIHRDIKPGNLLLGADQRSLQIGDLGSAALLPGNGPHPVRRNTFRAPVCTPMYAAPEVLLEECYSGASDIWAVGTSFYEVLTWQNFFPANYGLEAITGEARQYDYNKGPWRRALLELKSTLPPMGEIPEMVRGDFLLRPIAADLMARTATLQKLRINLASTGALPTSELRKAHFEELAQIRIESERAAAAPPPTASARQPPPPAS